MAQGKAHELQPVCFKVKDSDLNACHIMLDDITRKVGSLGYYNKQELTGVSQSKSNNEYTITLGCLFDHPSIKDRIPLLIREKIYDSRTKVLKEVRVSFHVLQCNLLSIADNLEQL